MNELTRIEDYIGQPKLSRAVPHDMEKMTVKKLITLSFIAMLASTSAYANGGGETPSEPETPSQPEKTGAQKMLEAALKRNGKDVGCTEPTSIRPTDYPADAKTWPCKNWSTDYSTN